MECTKINISMISEATIYFSANVPLKVGLILQRRNGLYLLWVRSGYEKGQNCYYLDGFAIYFTYIMEFGISKLIFIRGLEIENELENKREMFEANSIVVLVKRRVILSSVTRHNRAPQHRSSSKASNPIQELNVMPSNSDPTGADHFLLRLMSLFVGCNDNSPGENFYCSP